MRDHEGFLHRHPRMEYDLPDGYAVVSFDEWQKARGLIAPDEFSVYTVIQVENRKLIKRNDELLEQRNSLAREVDECREDIYRDKRVIEELWEKLDDAREWARYYKKKSGSFTVSHFDYTPPAFPWYTVDWSKWDRGAG